MFYTYGSKLPDFRLINVQYIEYREKMKSNPIYQPIHHGNEPHFVFNLKTKSNQTSSKLRVLMLNSNI